MNLSPMVEVGNCYILINRLELAGDSLTVAPGLTLRRIPSEISVFDLAAAGAVGFREWALLEPVVQTCRVELESAKDGAVIPGYDQLNRAWLASALLLLRGFGRHLCVASSSYSWARIAGHQKRSSESFHEQASNEGIESAVFKPTRSLQPFAGGLLDYHIRILAATDFRSDPVTAEDAAWVYDHFEDFNELCAQNQACRFALEALADWRYSQNPRVAIARLWSGIESLFSVSAELVYRISIVAASLTAERGETRIARFEAFKKLYGIRSKAVHGEELSEQKLIEGVEQSASLLRDLLLVALRSKSHFTTDIMNQAVMGNMES